MLRSMYSGISGMKNFQTKLDVIGNNIANVNTFGFKKGRAVFKDLYSQQLAGATGNTNTKGGVNPKQVGLGSQLSAIDTIDTPGSTQTTGRTLDMAISGDGYFRVAQIDGSGNFVNTSYTRAGNFYFDDQGFIVNSDGLYLCAVDPTTGSDTNADGINDTWTAEVALQVPKTAQSYSIGTDGSVTYIDSAGVLQTAGQILMGKFANPGGLEKAGSNLYRITDNSGPVLLSTPGTLGAGEVVSSALEMSNVDLSEEFTEMIVAQRGFQANTKIITTSDEILQELVNLKR